MSVSYTHLDVYKRQGLSEEELSAKKEAARRKYLEAGADLVIDSIRELPEAVEKLNKAAKGEYGNEQLL